MTYFLQEIVFAKCKNYKPWPGQIVNIYLAQIKGSQAEEYIYKVKYIGHPSSSDHCAKQLQKFNLATIQKYQIQYTNTRDSEEKKILKNIDLAWKKMIEIQKKQQNLIRDSLLPEEPPVVLGKKTEEKKKSKSPVSKKAQMQIQEKLYRDSEQKQSKNKKQSQKKSKQKEKVTAQKSRIIKKDKIVFRKIEKPKKKIFTTPQKIYVSKLSQQKIENNKRERQKSTSKVKLLLPSSFPRPPSPSPSPPQPSTTSIPLPSPPPPSPSPPLPSQSLLSPPLPSLPLASSLPVSSQLLPPPAISSDPLALLPFTSPPPLQSTPIIPQISLQKQKPDANKHQISPETAPKSFQKEIIKPKAALLATENKKVTENKKQNHVKIKQEEMVSLSAKPTPLSSKYPPINSLQKVTKQISTILNEHLSQVKIEYNDSVEPICKQQNLSLDHQPEILQESYQQVRQLNWCYMHKQNNTDSPFDQFALEDMNYLELFRHIKTRQKMLSFEPAEQLLPLANKYLQKMISHIEKYRQGHFILSMKRKQVLMAIFNCEHIGLKTIILRGTMKYMLDFVLAFESHSSMFNKYYEVQYEFIVGQLRSYFFILKQNLPVYMLNRRLQEECLKMSEQFSLRKRS